MNWMTELLQKRANLVSEARGVLDGAQGEKRALSAEEQTRYDALMDDALRMGEDIERRRKQEAVESTMEKVLEAGTRPAPQGERGAGLRFESRGMAGVTADQAGPEWRRVLETAQPEYRKAFAAAVFKGQLRALQVDSDTAGGYLLTPLALVDQLLKAVDDQVMIRQWATVMAMPNADSIGVPTLESDPADATWTTELGTGSEDSTMSFGRRDMKPNPLAKRIKISKTLLRKVSSAESLVISRLAYKFAITQEKAFLTGTGAAQPLGVFTASAMGISTGRDVSTDNTQTAVTFDGLINAKFTLKSAYWPGARWLAHRDFYKLVTKVTDGNDNYIWRESVRAGEPDMLLGLPCYMSEYAPNTFTAGLYVALLGDFSNYWIVDSMAMEMQRLIELYAETNQVGLIGRLETDGAPVLEEAFVRVKLAP